MKFLLKRILLPVITLALLVLGALWLYGYIGVKAGWIKMTDVPGLNAVSHHGAAAAGSFVTKIGL